MKITSTSLPKTSILHKGIDTYNYTDSFQAEYNDPNNEIDIVDIAKAFFNSTPKWVDNLLDLRNKIVKIFGLKTTKKVQNRQELLDAFKGEPGEQIAFFKVYNKSKNEIIMGEDDAHLIFRVSLLVENMQTNETQKQLSISTTVIFNNKMGNLYFFPVKPFHKLIVKIMLKAIVKNL